MKMTKTPQQEAHAWALRSSERKGLIVADHLDPDGKVVWRLTELGRSVLEGETLDDVLGDLTTEFAVWLERRRRPCSRA
jgi:DNA-binding PadR family transcriptional regulator